MNKKEYTKLEGMIERLTEKSSGMEGAIERLAERHSGLENMVEQLTEFVAEKSSDSEKRFDAIDREINFLKETKADKMDVQQIVDEAIDKQTDKLLRVMDEYAKAYKDQKQEQEMLTGQVNRHDRWINKIALQADVQLD